MGLGLSAVVSRQDSSCNSEKHFIASNTLSPSVFHNEVKKIIYERKETYKSQNGIYCKIPNNIQRPFLMDTRTGGEGGREGEIIIMGIIIGELCGLLSSSPTDNKPVSREYRLINLEQFNVHVWNRNSQAY